MDRTKKTPARKGARKAQSSHTTPPTSADGNLTSKKTIKKTTKEPQPLKTTKEPQPLVTKEPVATHTPSHTYSFRSRRYSMKPTPEDKRIMELEANDPSDVDYVESDAETTDDSLSDFYPE